MSNVVEVTLLAADLSRSDVGADGILTAASSIHPAVVDLHTHPAIPRPALHTHTGHITWTHIHAVSLQTNRFNEFQTQSN